MPLSRREELIQQFREDIAGTDTLARESANSGTSLDNYLAAMREAGSESFAEERNQINSAHTLSFD